MHQLRYYSLTHQNLRSGVTNSAPEWFMCAKVEHNSHQFLHFVVLWHLFFSMNDWTMPKLTTDLLRCWCGASFGASIWLPAQALDCCLYTYETWPISQQKKGTKNSGFLFIGGRKGSHLWLFTTQPIIYHVLCLVSRLISFCNFLAIKLFCIIQYSAGCRQFLGKGSLANFGV